MGKPGYMASTNDGFGSTGAMAVYIQVDCREAGQVRAGYKIRSSR